MRSTFEILDLGKRPYSPVLKLQEALLVRRKKGEVPDILLLVEHEPVYTLGRNAVADNITASAEELVRMGIEVVRTSRGGEVTYHGPGQLVGYPIIHLGNTGMGVVDYVDRLEETIIRILADFGLKGTRDSLNRGVWIGSDKIAAIGVRITGHVTMHGFALNVSTDLTHYRGIIPCGITNRGVTSLRTLGCDVSMKKVKRVAVEKFCEVFKYKDIEGPLPATGLDLNCDDLLEQL